MSNELYILIVMQSVGLILGLCAPIVTGCIAFSQRIEKSSCFGSSLELTKTQQLHEEIKQTASQHKLEMSQLLELLNKNKDKLEV